MTDMDETAVEAVAWMYERPWPDAMPAREVRDQQWSTLAGRYAGWTETPLYAANPATARVAKLEETLRACLDFLDSAPLESGFCMCGSSMESHSIHSGHSPVDDLAYHADSVAERARQVLASGGSA